MADREVKIVYKISDEGTLRVLDDIARRAGSVGEVVDTSTRRAGEGLGRFQASIITANQAMGLLRTAADAVRQVIDGVTDSIGRVDSYGELAKAVGLTVEELTSMRVAAKQGGLELGELGRSVSFLQRQIVEAAGGGGKLKLFESLGISRRELQEVREGSKSAIVVLGELGRAFDSLSRSEQVAASRELLSRNGSRLLNVINSDFKSLIDTAGRLGAVIDENMARRADEAANALDQMGIAVESLHEQIGVALAPVVVDIAGKLRDWIAANRELIATKTAEWTADLAKNAADAAPRMAELATATGQFIASVKPFIDFATAHPEISLALLGAAAGGRVGGVAGAAVGLVAGAGVGAGVAIDQRWGAENLWFTQGALGVFDWATGTDFGSGVNRIDAIPGASTRAQYGDEFVRRAMRRRARNLAEQQRLAADRFADLDGGYSLDPALVFGDPFTGTGTQPYAVRERINAALGDGDGRDRGRDKRLRQAERLGLDEERRLLEVLTERDRVRVALAEQAVDLRDAAVRRSREELELAKALGATEDQQLALAQRMDDLERQRLSTTRDRIQTELDGLLQFGPAVSQQVIELQTQLYLVDEQLARAPQYAERMRVEFERSRDVVGELGNTLADSLTRVVDGILAGGGTFGGLANNLVNLGFTTASNFAGQAIKGVNFGNLFKDVGSLFTGGEGGGDVLSAGTLSGLGAAAATYGASVALDIAVNGQQRVQELYRNSNLLRTTLSRGDIASAAGGGGIVGGIGRIVMEEFDNGFLGHFDPISMALARSSLFQAPTGGTQRAMALERIMTRLGLPQQMAFGINENGIRAQFLTNAPNAAAAAAFAAAGFGFDIPELRQPTIETLVTPGRNGATYAHSPNRVGAMLDAIEAAAAQRPGVEGLRTNEALGLGLVLTGGTRRGINVANLLTNNLLLTGASEGEARRQLRKIADQQGVTLTGGIEEAQRLYAERRLRDNPATAANEAQLQLLTAVEGLVGLFEEDIPAGVDVSALALKHFTEEAGIDIDGFNRELERSLEIFGALENAAEQGLRTGLGAGLTAFAQRNALIAGGGSISDIITANLRGREQVVSALFETISTGLSTAITEGVFDAVKDSAAWAALTEAIADAVGGASIADLPALIGDVVTTALPALTAAAETVAQIQAVIGVTPTSLRGRADTIAGGIKDRRYAQLSSAQQERYLRGELSRIDARLATPGLSDEERRRLLDERADVAFRGADLAASRYAPGSAAANRAVNEWLLVADTTRQQFESFADEQVAQIDAIKANTEALERNTEALGSYRPGVGFVRGPFTAKDGVVQDFQTAIDNYFRTPAGRTRVRELTSGK